MFVRYLIIAVLSVFTISSAQILNVHTKGNTSPASYPLSAIDSITFDLGTVTDIEGNVYHTVTIGAQVWMLENLRVTKLNDGTPIQKITSNTTWAGLTASAYCYYNNDSSANAATYGVLYNGHTVNTGKLAPTGWRIPSQSDWMQLVAAVGGDTLTAGGKLKETGTSHWATPNVGATNAVGFTALPGGCRDWPGTFTSLTTGGWWWSSTPGTTTNYLNVYQQYSADAKFVIFTNATPIYGYNVRCVKN